MTTNTTPPASGATWRAWLPVVGLTFAAFVFNTSEFAPIGLLSDIARDFGTSDSGAGMLITIYAWVVALASLPLMLLVSRMENRRLLLLVLSVFIASHLLSSVARTYGELLISRIGVACAHAVFWSFVSPLAVRVAPEGKRSTALGLVVTGTSVAMIIGLPLGRVIGLHVGWRMTFFYIGAAALAVMLYLAAVFPKVPSNNRLSLHKLPALLERPALMGIYVLTLVAITGHYIGYSYIEPFLGQVARLSDAGITWVLTAFGLVGLLGSFLFARYYERHRLRFVAAAVLGITLFLLLLRPAAVSPWTTVVVCVLWGLCVTFYNLTFQSEIIRVAPDSTAIAMSVYSGIFNVGIGSGALLGGVVCDSLSLGSIGYVGGAIAALASAYCLCKLMVVLR